MEIENKIYSIAEMREPAIFTAGYCFMDAPCTVIGTLLLKAQAHGKMLRLFFPLEDRSKVIPVVYWWQRYLGFYKQPTSADYLLRYVKKHKGGIHLVSAKPLDKSIGNATVWEQRA